MAHDHDDDEEQKRKRKRKNKKRQEEKDGTFKDKDKEKDGTSKDKDKEKDGTSKDKDKDGTSKEKDEVSKDKEKDGVSKDKEKDGVSQDGTPKEKDKDGVSPTPTPAPTPTPSPGSVIRGNPLDAIRDAPPGAVLDFAHERWEQPAGSTVVLADRTDLTIVRAFWVGPNLAPAEPSIWAQGGGNLKIIDSVIVGSPEVGKWSRELGNKQHGLMGGGTKGLTVLNTVLAHVGGDFLCVSDKPTKFPCEDVLLEDVICIYSRRQGLAFGGVRRATVRRAIITLTQRTVFDFESEGGGAHDFIAEDCHIDAGTRAPNSVFSIGGADREGAANVGPFMIRRCKVYGGSLTIDNRSTAQVLQEGNEDNLPMNQFPKLAPLLAQRYPTINGLAALLGVVDR